MLARIEFVLFICHALQGILNLFQQEGPLLHILWKELKVLFLNLLSKFLKINLEDGSVSELMSLDFSSHENCMDADRMEIGIGATRRLVEERVKTSDQVVFR